MALGQPVATGADFLNLKDIVARSGGPVLIFAVCRQFKPVETGTDRSKRGPVLPVVADIFIADGPMAGALYTGEEIIGAPTGALRGAKNPSVKNGFKVLPPANPLNTPFAFVVSVKNNAGNDYVAFDLPKGADEQRAEQLYAQFGDDKIWAGQANQIAPPAPAQQAQPAQALGGQVPAQQPAWQQPTQPTAAAPEGLPWQNPAA